MSPNAAKKRIETLKRIISNIETDDPELWRIVDIALLALAYTLSLYDFKQALEDFQEV